MKRITLIICSILTFTYSQSKACLNYYVLDSTGHQRLHLDHPPSHIFIYTKYQVEDLKDLEKKIPAAPASDRFRYISNYCALLIELGRFKEAIPVLETLLKEKPAEYEINANLAVALELNGQLDEALRQLKRSIEISPGSHEGSEWFHVKILEAAIELKNQNKNVQEMNVLKLGDQTGEKTVLQIAYQFEERVPLTSSPNSLLSKAMEESADYYYANLSIEWAIEMYAMAIGYSADPAIALRLWDKINSAREKLVQFRKQGKQGNVCKYLYESNWKKKINQLITQWRNYKPYYYDQEIVTAF